MEHTAHYGLTASGANQELSRTSHTLGSRVPIGEIVLERHSGLENALVLCVLVFSTSAFVNLLPGDAGIESEQKGQIFAQVIWSALYLLLFFLIRKRMKSFVSLIKQDRLILLLTAWAVLSFIWSIDRPVTFRRSIALIGTEAFGAYFALRYTLQEQLEKIFRALAIVVGASIFVCFFFPSYGISSGVPADEGAWQGVFSHKNTLGGITLLLALILFIHYFTGRRRLLSLIGIPILLVVVILSQSKTSLVYFLLAFIAFPLIRFFQKNPSYRAKVLLAGALIFGALAVWLSFYWEGFAYSLGRDPGLTGRTELWALSLVWIQQKPILGYGLDAFWSSYYGPAADFRIASGWLIAPHAHNAYLNLWLDLGVVGVLLAIGSLSTNLGKAIKLVRETEAAAGFWPLAFFGSTLAFSFTGGAFLARNDLFWILYISTALGMRSFFAQDAWMKMRSPNARRTA